jgi:hypothetical protein
MTTKLSVWGELGKLYVDRTELQLFLTDKAKSPAGYRRGWTVRHITDLTPPVSFYLRGEEYSAQLEAFGRAINGTDEPQRNDLGSAAETDLTIEMIRHAAEGTSETMAMPTRRSGVVARMFGR